MRSSLKWTGHVERMGDEKLAMRLETQKVREKEVRKSGRTTVTMATSPLTTGLPRPEQ